MYDFVAVDFETCNHLQYPCQVALVFVRDGKISETFSTYINPHGKFESCVSAIHGITDCDVLDAPDFRHIYDKLFRVFRHYPIVAHGAQFDKSVFCKACARYGLPVPKMTFYCTSALYRENAPELGCYKLDALCAYFDISLDSHHDALCDAIACAKLFIRLLENEDSAIYPLSTDKNEAPAHSSSTIMLTVHGVDKNRRTSSFVEPDINYDFFDGNITGKKVVITGDIEQATRAEVSRMVNAAGGRVTTAVSSKTDYLAVGMLDSSVVSDKVNHKSGKILSAESFRSSGSPIKIIRLSELYQSLLDATN